MIADAASIFGRMRLISLRRLPGNNTILLSPAAASFDQFLNFEKRGEEFRKLSKIYARRYIKI